MGALPTGTITFLFTDVEGSTRLWEHAPEAMGRAMAQHDDLIERCVAANAICERFLGNVRRECLNHVLVFGERQLYRVIQVHPERCRREYVRYYNRARPHQGIAQRIPGGVTG